MAQFTWNNVTGGLADSAETTDQLRNTGVDRIQKGINSLTKMAEGKLEKEVSDFNTIAQQNLDSVLTEINSLEDVDAVKSFKVDPTALRKRFGEQFGGAGLFDKSINQVTEARNQQLKDAIGEEKMLDDYDSYVNVKINNDAIRKYEESMFAKNPNIGATQLRAGFGKWVQDEQKKAEKEGREFKIGRNFQQQYNDKIFDDSIKRHSELTDQINLNTQNREDVNGRLKQLGRASQWAQSRLVDYKQSDLAGGKRYHEELTMEEQTAVLRDLIRERSKGIYEGADEGVGGAIKSLYLDIFPDSNLFTEGTIEDNENAMRFLTTINQHVRKNVKDLGREILVDVRTKMGQDIKDMDEKIITAVESGATDREIEMLKLQKQELINDKAIFDKQQTVGLANNEDVLKLLLNQDFLWEDGGIFTDGQMNAEKVGAFIDHALKGTVPPDIEKTKDEDKIGAWKDLIKTVRKDLAQIAIRQSTSQRMTAFEMQTQSMYEVYSFLGESSDETRNREIANTENKYKKYYNTFINDHQILTK